MAWVSPDTLRFTRVTLVPGTLKRRRGPERIIRTEAGWLHLAHGVRNTAAGLRYVLYVFVSDLDEPWRVVGRSRKYVLAPRLPYERVGDVPNVVFPTAALVDHEADRVSIYYGGADTVVCLAHAHLSELLCLVT